jgi:hypothetical protein
MIFQLLKGLFCIYFVFWIFGEGAHLFSPEWMWFLGLINAVVVLQSFFTFFRKLRETQEGNFMGWLI